MRVKMLTLDAGPNGVRTPGLIYTVDDAEGQQLVDGGYAELVEASKPKAAKSGKASSKKDPKAPAENTGDENAGSEGAGDDDTGDDTGDAETSTDTGDTPA